MYNPIKTKPTSLAFRERTFRIVHAAAESPKAGEAAVILNQRFAPPQAIEDDEGQSAADYRFVFGDLSAELKRVREAMHAANKTHLGQLALIVDLQKRRDNLNDQLFNHYFKARHSLEALFGRERGFEVLAVDGDTPRDPTGLINQVRSTVDFLHDPKIELPDVDLAGIDVDFAPMAIQLATEADDLEAVLTAIDRERKNAESTRMAKNAAITEFDRRYRWVGGGLETYFHLAGMHELADKVRPSARKPGRRAADEDLDPAAVEPTADTEPTDPAEPPSADPADGV